MSIYEKEVTNDEVKEKMTDSSIVVLDVRELSEYALAHIPGSVLIPLGELERRFSELDKEKTIFVICRTGNRSSDACHILKNEGFQNVYNVLPGMIQWDGPTDSKFG